MAKQGILVPSQGSSMHTVTPGRLALILGTLVAIGPLAIDTYLPALPAMAQSLGTTVERVETSVALYLIGAAFGQLFGGQLSDRYGRHPVAYAGLALFAAASIAICFITNIQQLLVLRLLQALGGGATVVIAAASVRDFYTGRDAARVLTTIGLVMLVAPLLAPAIGAVILHGVHWQGIFVMLAAYALLLAVLLWRALPPRPPRPAAGRGGMIAAYGRVLSHRVALGYILANAFAFSAMFVFITDSAFLYMEHFQISSQLFPVLFGANVVVMLGLNRLNILLLRHFESPRMLQAGLLLQGVGTSLLLILVLLDALTLALTVPLIMISCGAVSLVIPNAMASFLSFFEQDAGAATGLSGALQFLLAGTIGATVTILHTGSVLPMALVMAGCSAAAILAFTLLTRQRVAV